MEGIRSERTQPPVLGGDFPGAQEAMGKGSPACTGRPVARGLPGKCRRLVSPALEF